MDRLIWEGQNGMGLAVKNPGLELNGSFFLRINGHRKSSVAL